MSLPEETSPAVKETPDGDPTETKTELSPFDEESRSAGIGSSSIAIDRWIAHIETYMILAWLAKNA
jgi:hypothetical protein